MKAKAQSVTNFEAKFLLENLLFPTICVNTHLSSNNPAHPRLLLVFVKQKLKIAKIHLFANSLNLNFDNLFKISRMNELSKCSSLGGFREGALEGFGKAFSEGLIYIRKKINLYTAKVNLYTYENKFIHCENKFIYVRRFTYIRTKMG